MSRSILLVAYYYTPCPDTGAHRPAAMAKYLTRAGHRVTVLTTRAYGSLPSDEEAGVVRTRDLQLTRAKLRGRDTVQPAFAGTGAGKPHLLTHMLVPEPLIAAWAPFARRRAIRLHRETPFDCVITTSPPESVHSVGRALQKRGAAWIADLRDGWNYEPLRTLPPTRPQRRLDERLERRLLGAADLVTCVTEPMAADARERLGANATVVPSGFDPNGGDRAEPTGLLDPDRVSIVYTGRFGQYRRDPTALIEAVQELAAGDPETAAKLELVFAGPFSERERELLARPVDPARIKTVGTLPRDEALALQREADALLMIYAGEPRRDDAELPAGSPHPGLGSAKLFEYLGVERPILALAAGTEVGRIVEELRAGLVVGAADPQAIRGALRELAEGRAPAADEAARAEYAYPRIAERMSDGIEQAIARRG
jgi:glycosyltransferase involved in cell wall biosynthesis